MGFYLVSAYFQHCERIEPYLQHIDSLLRPLQGKHIILCMDSNANSVVWNSKHTDLKGEALEELISQHQTANRDSKTCTFDNIHGQDNSDVTLASSSCYRKLTDWTVHSGLTTSDHNLITFNIAIDSIGITSKKQ
ncbi:hypothetical protein QLX08_009339 [Tetragonisca angustula]|uniref:Endonuclease/exonuclease/phosphatase domain-containing protein n=1 Tax=Tetragonisca angustula TaxID=166442 RepID=A0AAW0ZGP4_9HYME